MKKLFSLMSLLLFALGITLASGVPFVITAPSAVFAALAVNYAQLPVIGIYSNVDLSSISRYATTFQRKLISTLVNSLDVVNDIMLYPGVKNYTKLPKLLVLDGFRPYSPNTEFGTRKDLVYSDRELKTEAGKRELLIDPEEYRPTYLSEMMSAGSGANKKEIPFAQFVWQKVIERVASEINNRVAYFGIDKSVAVAFDAGKDPGYAVGDIVTFAVDSRSEYFRCIATAATGQSPATHAAKWQNVTAESVCVGLGTIIADEITAGKISAVATGAIDNTTGKMAVAAFLKLFRAMPVAIRANGAMIHCSYTDFEYLLDDLEANYKYTVTDVTSQMVNGMLPLPKTDRKAWVKPATWMSGSRRLIANPLVGGKDNNMYFGTDLLSDLNTINTKENLWTLEAGIKAVLGFQIADLDAMKVGDQA